jgi:nitrite reductase (NO-forming)
MLLLGSASQLISGGQIKFSSTLAMAPPPARHHILGSLSLLNLGAALIAIGRLSGVELLVGSGAAAFLTGTTWSGLVADVQWRRGLGTRFRVTRTYYRLAGLSILLGGSAGATLALGLLSDAESHLSHRLVHMAFNLLGWAGMTIAGTAITLLPAVARVRAEIVPSAWAPWANFIGLLTIALGLTLGVPLIAAAGAACFVAGLIPFVRSVLLAARRPKRYPVPVSALHLIAAVVWLLVVSVMQVATLGIGNEAATRALWLVGLAGGTVVQAVLGAWSFLLPMEKPVGAETRRLHLVAFEKGARVQVAAYNGGLVLLLFGLLVPAPAGTRAVGLTLVWAAAAWALYKSCAFVRIARWPSVAVVSRLWWQPRR